MKLINTILNMISLTPLSPPPLMTPRELAMNAGMNQASNSIGSASQYGGHLGQSVPDTVSKNPSKSANKQIFSGRIEVMKVANGYVVNIATREGYEVDTYVASTIAEVNERIAASMVSFQLGKQ